MDVSEAVRTVVAVRSFQDTPVPAAVIRRVVEAGQLTGSSMNLQPWHFIVVERRETLQQLGEAVKSGPYIAQAAFAVVVAIERTRFAVSDGSRAIQSMILTAWSDGVGSNWAGFMGPEAVKGIVGIPGDLDVLAVVPFGYPAKPVGRGVKSRKPPAQVAHRERFGVPFS